MNYMVFFIIFVFLQMSISQNIIILDLQNSIIKTVVNKVTSYNCEEKSKKSSLQWTLMKNAQFAYSMKLLT